MAATGTDTLINKIKELSESTPNKTAVAFKETEISYLRLYNNVRSVAGMLFASGVKPGDRVVFSALSKPETISVYLGIQYIGGVAVFADKNGAPEAIKNIYEDSEAVLLITDKPMKESADGLNILSMKELCASEPEFIPEYHAPDADDLAELLYTTGTTGKPKGVMLTYRSVYSILSNTIEGIGIREDDVVLLPLPLNHSFALRVLRAVLYKGSSVVLQNGFTFAKEIENNIIRHECTALAAVSASLETVFMQMQDRFTKIVGKLRYIEISAGSLTITQRKKFTELLPNTVIFNTWGSSETGGVLFINVTEIIKKNPELIGSLGKPLPGVLLRVLDANGEPMESDPEHPGRMALKGDMQMVGYWKREDLTVKTLKDGWLLTGDMVYTDSNGYVFMLGRADDLINVGGEKVSPIEVEGIAEQFDMVRECACIGVSDPDGIAGQIPVLFTVAKSAAYSHTEMQKYLSSKLERYKVPQRYIQLTELPRNRMQKIDRARLRYIWENRDAMDLINPVMQTILSRRSVRRFTDEPIPDNILDMILEAGYHAPSGHNMQSWRFTVVERKEDIERLKEAARKAAKENNVYFYGWDNPKVLILISNDERNQDGCQDAAAAAENIFLAAQSYNIASVWLNPLMTLRHKEPVCRILDEFGIPKNHIVWCTAALGYPVAEGVPLAKKKDVVHYVNRDTAHRGGALVCKYFRSFISLSLYVSAVSSECEPFGILSGHDFQKNTGIAA